MFLKVAWSHLNTLYRWAGDDPTGLDCSGLVVECLKSVGLMKSGSDLSAQGIFDVFVNGQNSEVLEPVPGALLFWQNEDGRMIHVAICVNEKFCITADGGGSGITSAEIAAEKNAFVKIRPWNYRRVTPIIADILND